MPSSKTDRLPPYLLPGFVIVLAALAFMRIWTVRDVIWDDNTWLLTLYESRGLDEFLKAGFEEMQRPQLGLFLYALFWFHRYTEYFYPVWHTINTLTALASPLLLYFFLKRAFPKQPELAFFSALAFVVFHLDLTLPFASASNYRIGLALALLSFLSTERAVRETKNISIGWYIAALCSAVPSHTLFIEATIALEPARWFLLLHLLKTRHAANERTWRRALYLWLPFGLVAIPIIAYKLIYKPYGSFSHMYHLDPLFFTDWWVMLRSLAHYLLFYWFVLSQHLDAVTPSSWVLGVASAVIAYFALYRLFPGSRLLATHWKPADGNSTASLWRHGVKTNRPFLLLGTMAFLPVFLFFQLISRPTTSWDFDSSHAVIPLFGYSMLAGWLLSVAYRLSIIRNRRDPWMKYFFASILGAGIFFANANIDQYLKAWEIQDRFWTAFAERFPRPPVNSYFIMDIQQTSLYTDLNNTYSLEYQLNRLYANPSDPVPFRRQRVESIETWFAAVGASPRPMRNLRPEQIALDIKQRTYFGDEMIHTKLSNLVFVNYWNGKLLVNREIVERYPQIPYRDWADLPVPSVALMPTR